MLWINSSLNNTILGHPISKNFIDNIINLIANFTFIFQRIQNIAGKGENAGYQHFLPFPQCFRNVPLLELLKVGIIW